MEDVFLHLVNKEKEVDLTKNEASESAAEAPAEEAGAAEKVDLSKEAEAGEADKQDLSADSESDDKDQEKV